MLTIKCWTRLLSIGVLTATLATCSDGLQPDGVRSLGPLVTMDDLLGGENPELTQTSGTSWHVRIVTGGSCRFLTSEVAVEYRERMALIYPYEVRELCAERPLAFGVHEVDVSFRREGPWAVLVMGPFGVQWTDTVHVAQ